MLDNELKKKTRLIGKLPIDLKYAIQSVYHTFNDNSLSENLIEICQNCNKKILNVAVLKASDNNTFKVGLDCASTLQGLDLNELEIFNNQLKKAKSLRTSYLNSIKNRSDLEHELIIYKNGMTKAIEQEQDQFHKETTYWQYDQGFILMRKYGKRWSKESYYCTGNIEFFNNLLYPYIFDVTNKVNSIIIDNGIVTKKTINP